MADETQPIDSSTLKLTEKPEPRPEIRLRFAPSPTGYFHVGGARTALYNWLYARKHRGKFILRVEDTDADRSSRAMTDAILRDMEWLGLDWDEGPFFQTDFRPKHEAALKTLVENGHAYFCYCSKELIDQKRNEAMKGSKAYRYDKRCRELTDDERESKDAAGVPKVVRVKTNEGESVRFVDYVFGPIEIKHEEIGDFIIARADGSPIYNLASAVDDMSMRITHVVRGNEHISNTPKQILLYRALGFEPPQFTHLPLILGKDKKKLSKREGAASVGDFRDQGYLPEALMNYLALLGWSPGDDREFFRKDELIEAFSFERINASGAIFDEDKLFWLNSQYISNLDAEELHTLVKPFIQANDRWHAEYDGEQRDWFHARLDLLKSRVRTLLEFEKNLRPYLSDDFEYDEASVKKRLKKAEAGHMDALKDAFASVKPFNAESLEEALKATAETLDIKGALLIHPMRIALTGSAVGPSAYEVVEAIGREKTLARLERMAAFLRERLAAD